MPTSDFFNMPDATSTFQALGTWSSPMFNELFPLALLVAGLAVGGLVVSFIIWGIVAAFERMIHGKDHNYPY